MSNESSCDKPYTSTDKWTASVMAGLSFLVISSPYTYSLTETGVQTVADFAGLDEETKEKISLLSDKTCVSVPGLVVHSIVYTLVMRLMMERRNLSGCKKPYSSKDKWVASTVGGLMFLVVSSPYAYSLVDSLTRQVGINVIDDTGCPSVQGLLIHTGVFTLLTRLMMR